MNRRQLLTLPAAALAPDIDLGPIPRAVTLRPGVELIGCGTVTWEALIAAEREARRLLEGALCAGIKEPVTVRHYTGRFSPTLRTEVRWTVGKEGTP